MNVADIRDKMAAGQFEFSRHAFSRIIERNIPEEEVRQAGSRAEIIEEYPDDKYLPSCLLLGFTDERRPLHIQICYTSHEMLKVITVYEPDDERWPDLQRRSQA